MPQVTTVSGNPVFVDYTPGSAVTAGDVVVQNDLAGVAQVDLAANEQGALSVGGGVYLCTGDAAISVGKKVYWVDATNKVSESAAAGANKAFGWTVSACSGDGSTCRVYHSPF